MNTKLLRKIAKVIQEKPREFGMKYWHKRRGLYATGFLDSLPEGKEIACGTTHCIAGWAQLLSPSADRSAWVRDDAQRLLGLTGDQAERLFLAEEWPRGFGGQRCSAAKAAARIEHFIATGGRE